MKKRNIWLIVGTLVIVFTILGAGTIWAAPYPGDFKPPRVERQNQGLTSDHAKAETSDFSGSTKTVNATEAKRGDVLTYTIVINNSGDTPATVRVTDTMPFPVSSGILFLPADNPGTVVFSQGEGSFLPPGSAIFSGQSTWTWIRVIDAHTQAELVLRVELQTGFMETVTFSNQIHIDDGQGNIITVSSPETTYDPRFYVYLPIVLKNYPLAPPTPTSSPPISCAPQRLVDIPVGNQPRGLAVDEGRTRVYVANQGSSSVSVIDGHSNTVITNVKHFPNISVPTGIVYDSASDAIWVTGSGSDATGNFYWVVPINAETFAVGSPVSLAGEPSGLAFNPVDGNVYVAVYGSNAVSIIDPNTTSVITTVPVGERPYNLAVHRGTGAVYVANFGSNNISLITRQGTLFIPQTIALSPGSTQPFGIAVDDVLNHYVYVTTVNSYRIETIDINNGHQLLQPNEFKRRDTTGNGAPLRALALNMTVNQAENGHLWTTTSTDDFSDYTQVLLIPKGYTGGFFDDPVPDPPSGQTINDDLRSAGVAVNTAIDRVYVSLPYNNAVRVIADAEAKCFVVPFKQGQDITAVPVH
jgi:uncharacterized repeat protein (TIGR01451 family)